MSDPSDSSAQAHWPPSTALKRVRHASVAHGPFGAAYRLARLRVGVERGQRGTSVPRLRALRFCASAWRSCRARASMFRILRPGWPTGARRRSLPRRHVPSADLRRLCTRRTRRSPSPKPIAKAMNSPQAALAPRRSTLGCEQYWPWHSHSKASSAFQISVSNSSLFDGARIKL